jgi:hypothetical protein
VPAWGNVPALVDTRLRFELEPDGDGTRFLLTHFLPYILGREHMMAAVWHDHVDELERLVLGGGEDFVIKAGRLVELTAAYLDKDCAKRRAEYNHFLDLSSLAKA